MDVIFEPPKGIARPFSIEIGFFDTVLEIKEKVQKYHGIPVEKQTLIFKGQVLQDEHNVEYCELLQNSRVHLHIAPDIDKPVVKLEESSPSYSSSSKKIQIILKMPLSKTMPVEVDPNDTISQLKEKINEMERVSVTRLALYYNASELQDHLILHDCEIIENSEIDVHVKQSHASGLPTSGLKKLKIMVLTQCGTMKIPMEVNASDNVGELRKELHKLLEQNLNFHLPQEGYFFIYKQNVMDDDRSFRWHHVGNGDTVEIFNGSVTGGSS